MARKKIVSVVGGRMCNNEVEHLSHELGKSLAEVADFIVTGGYGGVMEAVSRGFKEGGGITIGITTSYNRNDANKYIDVVIPTGLGLARNVLVVKSGMAVIALPGSTGTLSEIAYALQFGIPVASLNSWDINGVVKVSSIPETIAWVKKTLKRSSS